MKACDDGTILAGVAHISAGEPTDRQRAYADALGIMYTPRTSPDELSALISQAKRVDVFPRLIELAAACRTVCIGYYKPSDDDWSVRLVEPYEVLVTTGGKRVADGMRLKITQNRALIYCYQLERFADDGWRHFRLNRIKSVKDGGSRFVPRRPVTLHTGEASSYGGSSRIITEDDTMDSKVQQLVDELAEALTSFEEWDSEGDGDAVADRMIALLREPAFRDVVVEQVHQYEDCDDLARALVNAPSDQLERELTWLRVVIGSTLAAASLVKHKLR